MPGFSNTNYLYQHLPSRFRRDDKDLFLKRYLQFFGETLDDYDAKFDAFFGSIEAGTASESFIEFWLENLFGWSWFPSWFTASDKRTLYGNFAKHLARRGTRRGIELWLADFRIHARAFTRPEFTGEWVWGEADYFVATPLLILVEVLYAEMEHKTEISVVGEAVRGEGFYVDNAPLFSQSEFTSLLRFVQPHAQEVLFVQKTEVGTPPLSTKILSPTPGETLVGTRNLTAEIVNAGQIKIVEVEYFDELTSLGKSSNAANNYQVTVNTEQLIPDGRSEIAARAKDNFGKYYCGSRSTVWVNNTTTAPRLTDFTAINFLPQKYLSQQTSQLEDFLKFIMTAVSDRKAGLLLKHYSGDFTPLRILDYEAEPQLEEGINFAQTVVFDWINGNSFADYLISNFEPLRGLDGNAEPPLTDGLRYIMTAAAASGVALNK